MTERWRLDRAPGIRNRTASERDRRDAEIEALDLLEIEKERNLMMQKKVIHLEQKKNKYFLDSLSSLSLFYFLSLFALSGLALRF